MKLPIQCKTLSEFYDLYKQFAWKHDWRAPVSYLKPFFFAKFSEDETIRYHESLLDVKIQSFYMALDKDKKQVAFYLTHEQAFANPKCIEVEIWNTDKQTGQIYPTGNKICKMEIIPNA